MTSPAAAADLLPAGLTQGCLADIVAVFERACAESTSNDTRVAGEQILLDIRNRADALPVAVQVIKVSESPVARFHAASAVRALLAENKWPVGPHTKQNFFELQLSLRSQLIQLILDRAANDIVPPFERQTVFAAVAITTRRIYLSETPECRASFFEQIWQILANPHSRLYAADLLQALVDELVLDPTRQFGVEPPGAMKSIVAQRELANNVRLRFARGGELAMMFSKAAEAANTILLEGNALANTKPLAALMGLCASILTSDFGERTVSLGDSDIVLSNNNGIKGPKKRSMNQGFAAIGRKPVPAWQGLLGNMNAFVELNFLCWDMARKSNNALAVSHGRACFVLLCGIHPDSISDSSAYVGQLISEAERWGMSKSSDVMDRSAYAEAWFRLVSTHGIARIFSVGGAQLLEIFVSNTLHHIRLPFNPCEDQQWENDCRDLLLETWAAIAAESESLPASTLPIQQHVMLVLRGFVEVQLLNMDDGLLDSKPEEVEEELDADIEDLSVEEARLEALAILARQAVESGSVVFLSECLSQRARRLSMPSNHVERRLLQDEIYWLVCLAGWVLADEVSGETPMIPESLLKPTGTGQPAPMQLLQSLLMCVESESELLAARGAFSDDVSPLVGRALCEALARISPAYLVPNEGTPAAAALQAIEPNTAMAARQIALRKAVETLLCRGGDANLCSSASKLLLSLAGGLSGDRGRPYEDLRNLEVWNPVANTVSDPARLLLLPSRAVRDLGEAVALVFNTGVHQITGNLFGQLRALCTTSVNIDTSSTVAVILNLLRGIARCGGRDISTRRAIRAGLLDPIPTLMKAYERTSPDVSRKVVKFLEEIACCHLVYMSAGECSEFFKECLALLQVQSSSLTASAAELSEEQIASSVVPAFRLLLRLLDKDAVDFAEDDCGQSPSTDVADVVYFGCSCILAFVTDGLLSYPDVAESYFSLVIDLVERYPEKMFQVPTDLSCQLLYSLEISLGNPSEAIVRRGLEGVASLARFTSSRASVDQTNPIYVSLHKLMAALLSGIVQGSIPEAHIGESANALLPIIGCDMSGQTFARVAECIVVESQLSAHDSSSLKSGFEVLLRSAQEVVEEASQPGNRGRVARGHFRGCVLQFSRLTKTIGADLVLHSLPSQGI